MSEIPELGAGGVVSPATSAPTSPSETTHAEPARQRVLPRRRIWKLLTLYWKATYSLVLGLLVAATAIALAIDVGRNVVQKPVVVDLISVPETLEKLGFSPSVAAAHLRDHILSYEERAATHMAAPRPSLQGDQPDVTLSPGGVSLSTISKTLLGFFHVQDARKVSGEITSIDGKLWLTLRLNGDVLFSSRRGRDYRSLDALFEDGAQAVLDRVAPFYVAVILSQTDSTAALSEIAAILDRKLPNTDLNVIYSYNLRGLIFKSRKWYGAARKDFEQTLTLAPNFGAAHYNLAFLLHEEGHNGPALTEAKLAIKYEPGFAPTYNLLGLANQKMGKPRAAEEAFKQNINMSASDPYPHYNLGLLYQEEGDLKRAATEVAVATKLAPSHAGMHNDLGRILYMQGNYVAGLREFHTAMKLDSRAWFAYNNAATALVTLSQTRMSRTRTYDDLAEACHDLRRARRLHSRIENYAERISEINRRSHGLACGQTHTFRGAI